jgi:hypothetical protein
VIVTTAYCNFIVFPDEVEQSGLYPNPQSAQTIVNMPYHLSCSSQAAANQKDNGPCRRKRFLPHSHWLVRTIHLPSCAMTPNHRVKHTKQPSTEGHEKHRGNMCQDRTIHARRVCKTTNACRGENPWWSTLSSH